MSRVLIAGAGIAGSYLWRLLVGKGMNPEEIEIIETGARTRCGITSCGFAVTRQFISLCHDVGLDARKYILATHDVIYGNSVKFKVKGYVFSIDKPAFIRDLLKGANVASGPSNTSVDRVIDATGTARAYIGKYDFDVLVPCIQRKVEFPQAPVMREHSHRVGYSWVIPLESNTAHIGIGSLTYDSQKMKEVVDRLSQGSNTICGCAGFIRGTGPISPLVRGNVWAVGEAGGIVEPLSGSGIVPAIVSAGLLVDHWDDPAKYEAAVMRKYGWFRKTAQFVQVWRARGAPSFWGLLRLWRESAELAGLDTRILGLMRENLIRSNMLPILLQVPRVRELLRDHEPN